MLRTISGLQAPFNIALLCKIRFPRTIRAQHRGYHPLDRSARDIKRAYGPDLEEVGGNTADS